MKLKLGILRNQNEEDHLLWTEACMNESGRVEADVIDFFSGDFLSRCLKQDYDAFLGRPPGDILRFKELYDERLLLLSEQTDKPLYPSLEEMLVYENKVRLASLLRENDIPHPRTSILRTREEAEEFSETCEYPQIGKIAFGAGGSGVKVLKDQAQLREYLNTGFSDKGLTRSWGPNLKKGNLMGRMIHRISHPIETYRYFRDKRRRSLGDRQSGFLILQDYIPHEFEWRCVRIGDSYFGHKKLPVRGIKASGTSEVKWDTPEKELLDFIKEITEKIDFSSVAIDVFEISRGQYLVNEIQCFFGSKNPHQMIHEGTPGRFVSRGKEWVFEPGDFNTNNSFDLRLRHVLDILNV